jgi:hypothetical protein
MALTAEDEQSSWMLQGTRRALLEPAKWYYLQWDSAAANSWSWFQALVCTKESEGCFAHGPSMAPDFYLQNEACASDWVLFLYLYMAAMVAYVGSWLYKVRERQVRQQHRDVQQREFRQRRRQQMARAAVMVRPHQD